MTVRSIAALFLTWLLTSLGSTAEARSPRGTETSTAKPGTSGTTLFVDQADPACDDVSGTPFCSIGAAVASATDGDVIDIGAGTYAEHLVVDVAVTLLGAGIGATVVDGENAGRVFNLLRDVTLERMTITGGFEGTSVGGAGVIGSAHTRLVDCHVTGNDAFNHGAGIRHNVGTLELLRTDVTDNTSSSIGSRGAGIYVRAGDLIVTDSRIEGNRQSNQSASDGGGIYFEGDDATLTRTTVSSNEARNYAGIGFDGDLLTIVDSAIHGNDAVFFVGGVGTITGDLIMINTTVSGNRALTHAGVADGACCTTTTLRNVTLFGNESRGSGPGGIEIVNDALVANSIVAGNTNADGPSDCTSGLTSLGHNLIQDTGCPLLGAMASDLVGIDPQLLPLIESIGRTATHALSGDSPALDAGSPEPVGSSDTSCAALDQRGIPRPVDGDGDGDARCDIGAHENERLIFADGFASGDATAWALVTPSP